MFKVAAFLAITASLAAQQILPEPLPVEKSGDFKPDEPPAPLPPPKPAAPVFMTSREAADGLDESELKSVVETLRSAYVRPSELEETALARARVQGLLERLGNGARVLAAPVSSAVEQQPFKSSVLPNEVAYIRLGTLNFDAVATLDVTLSEFQKSPSAVVLDLRATPANADFELAAEVCRRFCPRGRILFTVKRTRANDEEVLTSRMEPKWRGTIVVLVDSDTAGSAEVIAAVLRTHVGAYVVGQQTKGEAAQFEEVALAKGRILKIAVGEVTLPDATPVFPGGLRPDLVVDVPQETTDKVLFAALHEKEFTRFFEEKERPRMNEAALVAGTNPEMDAAQEAQKKKTAGRVESPAVRDIALQRALDFLTAVRVSEPAQRN
jgi:hypothetical protein